MTIRFEPLAERHIGDATALAVTAYARECEHVPALVDDNTPDALGRAVGELVRGGNGIAAVDDDRLLGYLAFLGPIEGFWGSTGCYAPLHSHAVTGKHRGRLISRLFEHAAAPMVARGVDTFSISTWRHDHEVGEALALNGFGIRLADAIRMVAPPLEAAPVPGIDLREIGWQDGAALYPLFNELVRHLQQSPTFLVRTSNTPEKFAAIRKRRQSRFFVACDKDTPVGYLEVTADGENVLTTAPDMVNICGAYLSAEFRGRGIFDSLLAVLLTTLRSEGVRRVGVDFETMNPTALHFWTKHFDRYTTSYARRLDAR